ncbi:MAG: extracellular solute-binding protein [Firmicutes bacterium]|nr:extracellular solute-binding protein [Bacillota bacterium]
MKKLFALLLAMILVLSLAACGGGDTEADNPVDGMETDLVVYATITEEQLDAWTSLFREQYPDVNIEIVSGSAGELLTRVTGEAAAPNGDVFLGGLSNTDGDKNAALFEAYLTPYEDELLEGYQSDNGFYSYNGLSTVCLCVNTDLEAELGLNIQSYADLLDPKLEGKILMADPNSSSSAWNNVCNLMSVYGLDSDEAWDYIGGLMKNVVIASSSSATFNSVVDGEYVVGLSYENGVATPLANGADNIRLVYPTEGVSAMSSGVAVIKDCPHPTAAKAFVDSIMSAEGQTRSAEGDLGTRFTNKNATLSDDCLLPPTDSINWVVRPVQELREQKAAILEKWNALYADIKG